MAQGDKGHGGGHNNTNKKGARGVAPVIPVSQNQTITSTNRAPGGAHIVGSVPVPDEVTKRPVRR